MLLQLSIIMIDKQTKLLITLAKRLRTEETSNDIILKSFVSAGILTKSGKFTKNYPTLRKSAELLEKAN